MASDSRAALLKASTPPSDELFSNLITANHILHHQKVLDAYGHISVRNPQNPATFFISRSLAPALVSCREDIEEYYVEDANPVNKEVPQGYVERFIHSELYKRYSDVNSVIHSHSEAVIPFSISSVPVRHVQTSATIYNPKLTLIPSFVQCITWVVYLAIKYQFTTSHYTTSLPIPNTHF
jgi:ribulose-5-phosphate 4-epimerase/fuculose-1-phosphate aldolase